MFQTRSLKSNRDTISGWAMQLEHSRHPKDLEHLEEEIEALAEQMATFTQSLRQWAAE